MSEKRLRARTSTPAAAYHLGQLQAYQTIIELARIHFEGLQATHPGIKQNLDAFQRALRRGVDTTWTEALGYVYGEEHRDALASDPEPVVYFDAAREIPRLVPGKRQLSAATPIVLTPPIRVFVLGDLEVRARIDLTDTQHIATAARAQLMAALAHDIRSATSVDDIGESRDRLQALVAFHARVRDMIAQGRPAEPGPVAEVVRQQLGAITEMVQDDLSSLREDAGLDDLAELNMTWSKRAADATLSLDDHNKIALAGRDLSGCDVQVCLRSDPSTPPAILLIAPRQKLAGRRLGSAPSRRAE